MPVPRGWWFRLGSRRVRSEVIAVARQLAFQGLNHGTTGNVSARVAEGFVITGSRQPYPRMRPRDLVLVDPRGVPLAGRCSPSRETPVHTAIYAALPDSGAIIHHHGPYCTALGISMSELSPRLEEHEYLQIGPVRVVQLGPDREESAGTVVAALAESKVTLLRAHGLIARAATVREACEAAVAVEHEARVAMLLRD